MKLRCLPGLLVTALLLAGCASTEDLSMTPPSKVERDPYGCHVHLRSEHRRVEGELIGLHEGTWVLMGDASAELLFVDTNKVDRAVVLVSRTSERPNRYAWSAILPFVSISHGYYGVFTLPLNLIASMSANLGAAKSRYVVDLYRPVLCSDLLPFARFPQDIPPRFFDAHRSVP